MSSPTFDAVVIGAGIVGAACAASLSREGLKVALVERDLIGGGATAAGMGHIVVMDDSEAQFALTRYSQELWMKLRAELPAEAEYQACGTLWIAADEEEMAEVRRKHRHYCERNVPVEIIDSETLRRLEPNLRPGMAGALLVPEDAVVYPPCVARFLSGRAHEVIHRSVSRIEEGVAILSNGTKLSAGIIVNAAGVWSPELTPGLPIKRRKGHLVITDRYPLFVSHQLVELGYLKSAHSVSSDSVAFNVQPRSTAQMLIGSSRQYGVEDTRVDNAILSRMLQRVLEYMPNLAQTRAIRTWTGFRAATPDKLPLIGPSPDSKTLFMATGHEGLGITTSLATAALLTDQVIRGSTAIPLEPYLPARAFTEHIHV